ncbi:serine acetyltransferase [Psychroserpens algicola]|uniref:serine acetyltransferase n=1 Tax=Psychroserpens algicola TaxID=1719034 RepID=UPI0023EF252C|nr:serine acetyltransferase [Psychroserpens algicola]
MIHFLKHAHRKLLITKLYSKYVSDNTTIQQDVEQTVLVRGCRVNPNTTKKKFHHLMLYYPEFAHIFFWRINARYHPWKPYFVRDFNCKIFGSTKIAGGLMCYHPFATVINAKSIGKNFQFRNSLTIGNKFNDNTLVPVIGDNVVVGANVAIIGDITIGDNVIIGAGSVIVKDVPSNSVVAGNPAKIIRSLHNE